MAWDIHEAAYIIGIRQHFADRVVACGTEPFIGLCHVNSRDTLPWIYYPLKITPSAREDLKTGINPYSLALTEPRGGVLF